MHTFRRAPHVEPLPALLRANGYVTGIIGKHHVNFPQGRDFDEIPRIGGRGSRDVAAMADCARDFFKKHRNDPFVLVMGYSDPHRSAEPAAFANEGEYDRVTSKTYDPADAKCRPICRIMRTCAGNWRSITSR